MAVHVSPRPATAAMPRSERVDLRRLWWVGLLAVLSATVVNLLVRAAAVALIEVPADFGPLQVAPVIMASVVGALGAIATFAIVAWRARRPIRTFRWIALVVLLLWTLPPFTVDEVTAAQIVTLELMHVIVAGISVGLLTTLTRTR